MSSVKDLHVRFYHGVVLQNLKLGRERSEKGSRKILFEWVMLALSFPFVTVPGSLPKVQLDVATALAFHMWCSQLLLGQPAAQVQQRANPPPSHPWIFVQILSLQL